MPSRMTTRDLLDKLISFDTTSRNPNAGLIDWIVAYLDEYGIASTRVTDDDPGKSNLLATIGPADQPGVVLAGHTDVVPIDGQQWSSDPWTVTERDGKLFGRGTCDMKSWSALTLARVPEFIAAPLKKPVHLAFSYDEETTCDGALSLGRAMRDLPTKPEVCIVGEPSGMQVVTGQKGCFSITVDVHGKAAHSSLAPEGVNAVEYACKLMQFCTDLNDRYASTGPLVEGYEVPHTTVTTTIAEGGTALNIVPEHCRVETSIRSLPNHSHREIIGEIESYVRGVLEPEMKTIAPETRIDTREWSAFRGYELPADSPEVQFVRSLSGRNEDLKVTYFSEAGIYADEGLIPSLICGPGFIDQAHKPDEFISLDQLAEGERFLDRLIVYLCR